MSNTTQSLPDAGGACGTHGVYVGRRCPKCAETSTLAALRQSAWEATQYMGPDEVREYVDAVMREVESDAP